MKVLHIDASLRQTNSLSRQLSTEFVQKLSNKYSIEVDRLDLTLDPLPHINQTYVDAMYTPLASHTPTMKAALKTSDALVNRLFAADVYVMGLPMYNFGIPSVVKSFFDHIVRSGLTFTADETGFHGQLKSKRVVVINARGGAYNTAETTKQDFVTNYLQMIWKFIGVENMAIIPIEPTLFYGPEAQPAAIAQAQAAIDTLLETW